MSRKAHAARVASFKIEMPRPKIYFGRQSGQETNHVVKKCLPQSYASKFLSAKGPWLRLSVRLALGGGYDDDCVLVRMALPVTDGMPVTIELEGSDKPVCVAESLMRFIYA